MAKELFLVDSRTYRNVVWQSVADFQLGDFFFESLSMIGFLDSDGREVLRRHPRDGRHVVPSGEEQIVVLLKVQVG